MVSIEFLESLDFFFTDILINLIGWEMPYVSPDRPVGLTNIANTCYLNSLLQVSSHSFAPHAR